MAGRPKHVPTDQQRVQVEAMAGYGITQKQISAIIGIADKTLTKHYRADLVRGDAKATTKVAESLYKQAIDGNTAAAIFWMKARAGWSEKSRFEIGAPGGGPVLVKVIERTIVDPSN